jgi:hypothetical protein
MRRTGIAGVAVLVVGLAGCTGTTGGAAPPLPSTAAVVGAAPTGESSEEPSVPESLLLPDEGGRSEVAEFTDWITDRAPTREWLLDPCVPTAYPTDAQRVRFRTATREGPEAFDARQLGVYPSAEVAAEVVAGFRRVLDACRTGRQPGGAPWTWATAEVPELGDEGLLAASVFRAPGYSSHGVRVAVTRVGNAVFLAHSGGEYGTAEIDDGAQAVREVAQRFLDSL